MTLLAYGCVTPMALDRNELNRLKDEPSIAVVYYRAPDFIVAIPEASSLFGGGYIYMATAKSAGERMICHRSRAHAAARSKSRASF